MKSWIRALDHVSQVVKESESVTRATQKPFEISTRPTRTLQDTRSVRTRHQPPEVARTLELPSQQHFSRHRVYEGGQKDNVNGRRVGHPTNLLHIVEL